jgi:hypothetical protein
MTDSANDLLAPYSIDRAPPLLVAADQPDQQLALNAALRCDIGQGGNLSERFLTEPVHKKTLDYYKVLYEDKQHGMAVQTLLKRHRVDCTTSSFNVPPKSPNLSWEIQRHFIDLKIYVGRGLGLGGMMPNVQTLHTYEFHMNIEQPNREFKTKYAKLGFDPVGCMLWIGRSPNAEDVWLAWAPTSSLNGTEDIIAGTSSGPTTMSQEHYRQVVMFLASGLARIQYRDAYVFNQYPDVFDDDDFANASNLP